jgi:YVTN family beta-propeller protein
VKTKFKLLSAFIITLTVMSCDKKNDAVKGEYQSGVFVANVGQFGHANGDITYYNPSSGVIGDNIYHNVNGSFAGDAVQSIAVDGDNGYIVASASNTVEIVNANTFKLSSTFTNPLLINPRYLAVINGKAYVSTWGSYDANYSLTKSYVLVFDTKSKLLVDTIGTDLGAENVLYNGKYLFVSKDNYSGSTTVSVIDPSSDKQIKKINLPSNPSGLVVDANSKLWVITNGTGSYDVDYNYIGNNDGALYRINPSTFNIEQTVALNANPGNQLTASPDKKTLYYAVGNAVYKISIDATTAPANAFINDSNIVSLSALGVNPKSSEIYVGDAPSFTSPGKAHIYNADGSLKTQITTGIDPIQFIFR